MPLSTKKARITVDATRVGDVIDCTPSQSIEEEDTSVIDRAEANYAPRTDIEIGTAELSANIYVDLTDPGQSLLHLGKTGIDIVLMPAGIASGLLRQTYTDCIVTEFPIQTVSYKGRLKRTVKFKANGGMVEDTIP